MQRLETSKDGFVDDLVVTVTSMVLHRSGTARYRLQVSGKDSIIIDVWSTQKSDLTLTPDESPPDWVVVARGAAGGFERIQANDCDVHFEQMDRRSYVLGLERGGEYWGLTIASPAYTKARVVPADRLRTG